MKFEFQKKLYDKYPKIFRQKDLPMTETAMCWGIECDDGWFDLIDTLCFLLQHSVVNGHPQIEAIQVKEKFGGLRFYVNGCDDYQDGLIAFAENFSYNICEICGTTRNVGHTKNFIKTICEDCYNKSNINLEFVGEKDNKN